MADQNLNFDANNVAPNTGKPDPVPAGEYTMMTTESEVKPTKDGRGKILALTHEILDDGPYKGRKVWDNLNIVNPSQQAQQIAQSQLSALCRAVGVLKITNSQQLHGRPFRAKVGITQDKGYDPKNEVKVYKAADGSLPLPAPAAASSTAPGAAQAAAPATPPWARAG